ncbi:uncharacterized protein LOC111368978 [Olea europaea var. sylvestris]|uniref:uncharacterized protein LOC111368978 n=1 Tax=Olea europaea var. sylvestris TaxID=158386 RepID=UPI000C1CCC37|nr:uncharacterized protein LOC111368978 [Olea europaea var. sylvestris]
MQEYLARFSRATLGIKDLQTSTVKIALMNGTQNSLAQDEQELSLKSLACTSTFLLFYPSVPQHDRVQVLPLIVKDWPLVYVSAIYVELFKKMSIPLSVPVSLHSHTSSVPLFNGLNSSDWCEQVQFNLGVLDLDLALQVEKPADLTDESSADERSVHKAWERSNRLSLMFMRMTLAKNIKSTIPKTENAKEYMKFVEERSQTANKSLAGTLMSTLTTMKFDGSRTKHELVTEMSNIAARLKTLGMIVGENFLVQFIINSLPPEYGPFHMNYNTLKDKWNVNELHSMLVQEETRLKNQGTHFVHLVSHQGARKKYKKRSEKGIKQGPLKINESSAHIHNKEHKKDTCHFCRKPGHHKKDCLKRNAWFESKGKIISYGFLSTQTINPNEKFVLMGNRVKAPVEAIGTYRLILDTGHHLDLFQTLYLDNLFAETLLTLHHNIGTKRGLLNERSANLWYKRLGHISKERIERLLKNEILHDLDFSDLETCVDCIKGKQTKHTKKGATRSTQLLEIIHTDICGPFDVSSFGGEKYFITFIDDFSRYDRKVKIIRSDRGGEYYGKYDETGQHPGPFAKFLERHGICSQYTMPGTPQQNGVAEKRNRTLIEMVRFIENGEVSVSFEPRNVEIQEVRIQVSLPSTSSNVVVPQIVKRHENLPEQQINGQTPHNEVATDEPALNEPQEITLKRSQRQRRPAISDDYVVYLQGSEFDLGIVDDDPVSFSQAIESANSDKWLDAMKDELKSMEHNEVWDLVELPESCKRVGCKWVFETKRDSNGNIEQHKARLVAKDFTQKSGIDYKETFSPVSKKDSLRIIMSLVAHYDLELQQMDASRQWYLKFNDTITSFGFKENVVDRCIYLKVSGSKFIFLILYVDDILLATNDFGLLYETKKFLSKNFEMKDMGETTYVIGIEIFHDRSQGLLRLSQKVYINKVIERFNMKNCSASVVLI